ncbi:MAG: hypothetical protein ABJD11_00435 [Gemmatimonadota bacterium]
MLLLRASGARAQTIAPGAVETQVGRITVIADPAHLALGIGLAERADRPLPWPGLGTRVLPPFRLIVVADAAALARISRGRAPAWGAGIALPDPHIIILRADLDGLDHTLRHELGHLALHDAVKVRVPLWFDEGYASWGANEWDRLESLKLNLAVASGSRPGLRELDGLLRGSANTADAAYALAVSAVLELARRNPSGTIAPLMSHLEAGEDFDSALVETTGLTESRFETEWQRSLKTRYGILTWLLAGGFWAIVAFGLGGILWARRRADAPRRAALNDGWVIVEDPEPPVDQHDGVV